MIIIRFIAVFLLGVLAYQPVLSQTLPSCHSLASDADGDGYGWENDNSCVITGTSSNNCDYSNADMFDGWGWDAIAGESCAPTTSSVLGTCDYTNAAQYDGWGWNAITGQSCEPVISSSPCIDSDGDGWGWQEPTNAPGGSCRVDVMDIDNSWPNIGDVSGGTVHCETYVYEPAAAAAGIGTIAVGWVQAANGFSTRSWSFNPNGTGLINGYGLGSDRSFTWYQSLDGTVTMTNSFGESNLQGVDIQQESWNATPDDWVARLGASGRSCYLYSP